MKSSSSSISLKKKYPTKPKTKILQNKRKINSLNSEYTSLLEKEESLNSEVTKLQDPDYVARYAREKYMYSLPDEVIIRIPE